MSASEVEVETTWFLEGEREVALLSDTPTPKWIQEYRELAKRGVGVVVWNETGEKRDLSVGFLDQVVDVIPALKIATIDRIRDLDVLAGAPVLRNVSLNASGDLRLDMSELPALVDYQGVLNRHLTSVLRNDTLRYLELVGRMPSPFTRVLGPVERFTQIGASNIELLEFSQPEALMAIVRAGAKAFDLRLLSQFENLRSFRLERCADVRGIGVVGIHPSLEDVGFLRCVTAESWDDLDFRGDAMLMNLQPRVSDVFASRARARGWAVG